ncbi:hypothetical protein F4778DRAFT_783815 [Xylariomycetidae sp. FL2044]|nr:hypothetical protein F4778DRAFT_783815 [Xylariomycetidae sp. FL2044]
MRQDDIHPLAHHHPWTRPSLALRALPSLRVITWVLRRLVHHLSGSGGHFPTHPCRVSRRRVWGRGSVSVSCFECIPLGAGRGPLPVLIVLEGGGFVLGEPNDVRAAVAHDK